MFLLLLLTPIRSIAILVSPLFLYGIYCIHPFKVQRGMRWLIALWGITSFMGVLSGTTNLQNVMVSVIIFLPMLYLFFIKPQRNIRSLFTVKLSLLQRWMLYILIPLNIFGGVCWVKSGMIGDAWGIPYGSHYETVHGLAMINIYVLLYLGLKIFYEKRDDKTVFLFVFFLISIFGCQYGLGMICLFISILIYLLMMRRIKTVVLAVMVLAIGSWLLTLDSFRYERENIMKAENGSDARKMEMFVDFFDNVNHDMTFCVVGTGAGGYNSRSALLLSPDHFNPLKKIFGSSTPPPPPIIRKIYTVCGMTDWYLKVILPMGRAISHTPVWYHYGRNMECFSLCFFAHYYGKTIEI
ncbi:hypothetical protein AB9N12_17645 [Bacteroides sp. AN502(2024)]|uniref:hypothetical protein n=1 Tax=Bacteroides sp. AN502(2024) TaxID=3160599 RepID=UPI003513B7B2